MRAIRLTLWVLVAVALFAAGALTAGWIGPRSAGTGQAGSSWTGAADPLPLGGAFALTDQTGAPITEAVFRDKPAAVFFGFTHCPDVCPTALMDMAHWAEALGSAADKMRFVFVTVDPERDGPAVLSDYLSAFSDRIIGITGDPGAVRAMLADYKIHSRKVPLEGGGYTMDHAASVLLLDANGSLVGTIDRAEQRDTAVEKIRRLVAG